MFGALLVMHLRVDTNKKEGENQWLVRSPRGLRSLVNRCAGDVRFLDVGRLALAGNERPRSGADGGQDWAGWRAAS